MNESIREQLSAMADGEIQSESTRFLLKRLDRDTEFRGLWERYHLIRDCLRRQDHVLAPSDFCQRVSQQIESDLGAETAAHSRPQAGSVNPRRQLLWRSLAGGAIAAGVAVVSLFSVRAGVDAGLPQPNAAVANLSQVAAITSRDLIPPWKEQSVARTDRFLLVQTPLASELDRYFMRHGEAAGGVGALGMLPAVRAVSEPVRAATADTAQTGK